MAWAMRAPSVSSSVGTIADSLEPREIDQSFIASAIQLWQEYFWPHARAALRQVGLTDRHADARRVLKWIRAQGKEEVSGEEVRRDALSQRLDAAATHHLLDALVAWGWLQPKRILTRRRPAKR